MSQQHDTPPQYPLTVYYDGACPICRREIGVMRRLDRRGRLRLIDFSQKTFRADQCGVGCDELSRVLHGQWPDGGMLQGVEVFRAMWTAVGLGFLARLSRRKPIDRILTQAYAWFARNRLRLTRRTDPRNELDTSKRRME